MERINQFKDVMVKNLQPSEKLTEYTEGNGFCLRITPKGKKVWFYRYKINYVSRRFTVGYYPSLSVAEARKAVSDAGELKDKGIDPAQDKKDKEEAKAKEEAQEKLTIKWLVNEFYDRYVVVHRKAPIQIKQQKDADIIPLLGGYRLDEITTLQITQALDKIVGRGSPVHANKVLRTIKQMFNYAISKGITERYNPAMPIKAKDIGGVELSRDRYLSFDEIKALWLYLDDKTEHSIHPATIAGLKVLLLTGVRTGSIIKAEWKEIDFDNSLWTIPPEHLKLKKTDAQKPHKVHLTEFTKSLFLELKNLTESDFVIPHRDGDKPAGDKLFSRVVRRSRGNIKGIKEDFNAHDFRTTISTHLMDLDFPPHIADLCIGHKLQGMAGVYIKNDFRKDIKKALQAWSDKIEILVTNSNVIPLNTKSKKVN